VIDLNKEIKLSDLVRKTAKAGKRSSGSPDSASGGLRGKGRGRKKSRPRELVGLKVGATQLAAARVVNNGGAHLVQVARQPLPQGIVGDGEVRDVAALAAGLDEFFTVNSLPRQGVRLGLATNHVGVRIFEIAGIDDDRQLANAVLFRAHDAISIPVDEAVIDYRVIGRDVDESGTVIRRILLVAAYREPIERFAAAFQQAGIRLAGVDLEAFALLRAVRAPVAEGESPVAAIVVVNVGHERTTLAVSDGTICQFTRVLEWGGSKLVGAIEREVAAGPGEASELLLGVALDSHMGAAPGADDRPVRAREAARHELQALARELVASLEFYQGQPGSLPISEILLSGGTSRVRGLAEELERLTRVRVRLADPLARVEVGDEIEPRDDLASLAVAIGLGVDD
jgi:type IV pilus assembly protein PilM